METKQENSNYLKGSEGEKRVAKELLKHGLSSIHVGGATKYQIDGGKFWSGDLVSYGLKRTFWVQVKYKEPRKYYPDTGLERFRYKALKYLADQSGCPVILLFTEESGKIYGDWIENLKDENHPGQFNKKDDVDMVYFWLKDLKPLEQLVF